MANLALANTERENRLLAPYAFRSDDSAGRVYQETDHPYRGPFQRDRDRIVHSSGYRRLAHKTQVFTGAMGDYHRTRLTHTLEVASISRTIGRALRLNEDLIESLALLHDVGHPPFGHAGEDVLDDCLSDWGGFNHNRQALRLVELLETRYPEYPGLNLSIEVLAGQHQRSIRSEKRKDRKRKSRPPKDHFPHDEKYDENLKAPPCKAEAHERSNLSTIVPDLLEFQVVDAADSIAYDTHDVDDALALGLLELNQLLEVPLWSEAAHQVHLRYANLDNDQLRQATVHQLIEMLVSDLLTTTSKRIGQRKIIGLKSNAGNFKACALDLKLESTSAPGSVGLVGPSSEIADNKLELEEFLFTNVYRHPSLLARREKTNVALRAMFESFVGHPERLPKEFLRHADRDSLPRAVGDYLSCMTDRCALEKLK